jgi:hypothetical protein
MNIDEHQMNGVRRPTTDAPTEEMP